MKRTILNAAVALLLPAGAFAQSNFFMVEYPVGFPQGELQDYIAKTCWRGIGFGYRYLANDNMAIGMDMSNNLFYERKDKDTYTFETTSITGVQYRYQNAFNVSAQMDYVMAYGNDFRPFIGMGVGSTYVHRATDFGVYRFIQDTWQFMLQPEVGFSYYLSGGTGLIVSANYYAGFDNQELEGQTFVTVNVGLIWATD